MDAQRDVVVVSGAAGSQSGGRGLKQNDDILKLGEDVGNVRDFIAKLKQQKPADRRTITVWRNQSEKELVLNR